MSAQFVHKSVLLQETLVNLKPQANQLFVDGTFGAGGISRAILESADCSVIAFDRDPEAIARGAHLVQEFKGRLELIQGRFGTMELLLEPVLKRRGQTHIDGVTLDLGVSSPQIDDSSRGFSFMRDGPLDMRMSLEGMSAADFINTAPQTEIANVLWHYGEERSSRRIARAIVERRALLPFTRTLELATLIEKLVRKSPGDHIHAATRTFQALRIAVNEELKELSLGLSAAERLLRSAGRLVVVSFHSLEDRIVKLFLADRAKPQANLSRHMPANDSTAAAPSFRNLMRRPATPSAQECADNPRARSAKLRAAERTDAPSHPLDLKRLGILETRT